MVGMAGLYGRSVFNVLRTLYTVFCGGGVPVYISTDSVVGYLFLHILASMCYDRVLIVNRYMLYLG